MNILKVLTPNRIIGNFGERRAVWHLIKKGYRILERNYEANGAEIDIIARKKNITAFVEVKARKKGSMVSPLEAVNHAKQNHLRIAASRFIQSCDAKYKILQPRFDVVCVTIGKIGFKVTEHIENAF